MIRDENRAGAPETPTVNITLTPDMVRRGGDILSRMQGCEDPLGQRSYYEGLFKDLIEEVGKIAKVPVRK